MIGKNISHYKILEKLGEGGMGVVYKAEDTKLKRTVALKFLPSEYTRDTEAKERFVHEARAASSIQHNNICTIHEIDETDDGQIFICMDHYEGESLQERIKRGPLTVENSITIGSQIAQGLAKAHEKGIVHRDIKPANIHVTDDGVVKILDFGLAKLRGQTKLTKEGTTLGTVAYMSPEQARGETVDHRTDIWSLGVALYEMITGQHPFKGDYEQAVVYSILNEEPEPLTGLRTGVPVELERIVNKCLQKNQSERYQTADDLMADFRYLQRISSTQTIPPKSQISKPRGKPLATRLAWIAALVIIATVAIVFILRQFSSTGKQPVSGRKMLVVLPFENLGPPEDEYFADGITEEITSRLASLHGLGVISRTSAFHYKETDKTIGQIGQELKVDYVLEGTVRWERVKDKPSRVRVTPQLIRVSDDTHLWTERYDDQLEEIFTVQSNIAEEVVQKLNLTLLEPEKQALGTKPTENLDAYQAYLKAFDYEERGVYQEEEHRMKIQLLQRAVELDPNFVLAWASLSHAHSNMINLGMDRTQERAEMAKSAVDYALELDPDSPEAHLALGYYYYYALRDYDIALKEFAVAGRNLPNDSEVLAATAWIRRRQGRWNEAIEIAGQAFELNPMDSRLARELGNLHFATHQFEEAIEFYDRSIALAPDQKAAYVLKTMTYLNGWGDMINARKTMEAMPSIPDVFSSFFWFYLETLARNYDSALEYLRLIPVEVIETPSLYHPKKMFEGFIYFLQGKSQEARSAFNAALQILEQEVEQRPEDARIHSSLGAVYAFLGRKEEAIYEGKLAVELYPVSLDAMHGPSHVGDLAAIYIFVGEHDKAIDLIEYLLSIPGSLSVHLLRLDPRWDLLRDHPRFQKLLME